MVDWTQHEPLVAGIYLVQGGARGKAKLFDSFVLPSEVKRRKRWDDVKAEVAREIEARGLKLRTISRIHEPKDIHVAVYVIDRGQGSAALTSRKKPVRRAGPHGGPLGRHVKKSTAKKIASSKR